MSDIKANVYDDYKVISKILMLKGEKGNDIKSITTEESSESGGTNVVTITLSDGTAYKFDVKNGKDYTDTEHAKLISYIDTELAKKTYKYSVEKQEITVSDTSKTSFTFDFDLTASDSVNVGIYWEGFLLTKDSDYTIGTDGKTITVINVSDFWTDYAERSTLTAVKEYLVG